VGELVQVPLSAVSREPTDTVPEMEGATLAAGAAEGVPLTVVEDSPAVDAPFNVVTARIFTEYVVPLETPDVIESGVVVSTGENAVNEVPPFIEYS